MKPKGEGSSKKGGTSSSSERGGGEGEGGGGGRELLASRRERVEDEERAEHLPSLSPPPPPPLHLCPGCPVHDAGEVTPTAAASPPSNCKKLRRVRREKNGLLTSDAFERGRRREVERPPRGGCRVERRARALVCVCLFPPPFFSNYIIYLFIWSLYSRRTVALSTSGKL